MKGMVFALLWLAPLPVFSQTASSPSVKELHDAFLESVDPDEKNRLIEELSRTPIRSVRDAHSAHDLFVRFADQKTRNAVMESLNLMDPNNHQPEPAFLTYLEQPEAETLLFGIKGTLRLRSPQALPVITKLAQRPFLQRSPAESPVLSEKNAWWAQYEALSALAQWQGAKVLPLLIRKTSEAPAVAQIMALNLWKESLPQFVKWSASRSPANQEKAKEGLRAPVSLAALQETRLELLNILRDPKADKELRHQIAIKLGISSREDQVGELLKEHGALSDPQTRLMFETAIFSSRSPQAIPLLLRYAKENPDLQVRAGARIQLKDMLDAARYRELLEWAAKNDPDGENRKSAAEELR